MSTAHCVQHLLATEPFGVAHKVPNCKPRVQGEAAVNEGSQKRSASVCGSPLPRRMLKPPPGLLEPTIVPPLATAVAGAAAPENDASGSEAAESSCCSTAESLSVVGVGTAALHLQEELGDLVLADSVGQRPRLLLSLDAAVPEPFALGSAERPTVGSSRHHLGLCKPCAHAFSKRGCLNGVSCAFCHLCEPGELKRRQKERQAFKNATRHCKASALKENGQMSVLLSSSVCRYRS